MQQVNKEYAKILITVAHPSEEEAVRQAAAVAGCSCEIIITGVGGAAMSWALQKRFAMAATPGSTRTFSPSAGTPPGSTKAPARSEGTPPGTIPGISNARPFPSLVIGAGIAGSYVMSLPPGTVVVAKTDCFADMGIDDNGHFIPLFSAGLAEPDTPPFSGGRIRCSGRWYDLAAGVMPAADAATVNMASGSPAVIERIRMTWSPEIETMEGAWLAYACTLSGIPWLSVRAVSNMVEPRNLKNWDIPLALRNLREKMTQLLELIAKETSF
jgi:futalosine hydrolase